MYFLYLYFSSSSIILNFWAQNYNDLSLDLRNTSLFCYVPKETFINDESNKQLKRENERRWRCVACVAS